MTYQPQDGEVGGPAAQEARPLPLSYERQRHFSINPPSGVVATFSIGMAAGAPLGFLEVVIKTDGVRYARWFDAVAMAVVVAAYVFLVCTICAGCFLWLRRSLLRERCLTALSDRTCLVAGLCAGILSCPLLDVFSRYAKSGELIVAALLTPIAGALLAVIALVRPARGLGKYES